MEQTIKIIRTNLKGFELLLFDAAIENLREESNILNFNNFAYTIRELIGNIMDRLAPDDEVKSAPWYESVKNENDRIVITRKQRLKYAIQKWFLDDYAENILHLKLDAYFKDFTCIFNALHKYTHIREDTFNVAPVDKTKMSLRILDNLLWLINILNNAQSEIINSTIELAKNEFGKKLNADYYGVLVLTYGKGNDKRYLIEKIAIKGENDTILNVEATGFLFIVDPQENDPYKYKEMKPFFSELDVNYKNKEGIIKIERGSITIDSNTISLN